MRITIQLKRTKGEYKQILELYKDLEVLQMKYINLIDKIEMI